MTSKSQHGKWRFAAGSLALFLFICAGAFAQQQPAAPPAADAAPQQTENTAAPSSIPAPTDPHQAALYARTQKLLKLAQELKAEVAKSDKDTLSLSVVKKAEEIEKLARSLKEEMNKTP